MALVRGYLTKLLRPSVHLNHVCCKSSLQVCNPRISSGETSVESRVLSLCLQQTPNLCRQYCINASPVEKIATDLSETKEECSSNITEEDAGNIALNSMLQNMQMTAVNKYLLTIYQKRKTSHLHIKTCFRRLLELISENPDRKEGKKEELFKNPSFQKLSKFIEENMKDLQWQYLTAALSFSLEITGKDVPLIKALETVFLRMLKQTNNINFLKELAAIHENHQETGLRKLVYQSAMTAIKERSEEQNTIRSRKLFPEGIWEEEAKSPAIQELLGKALLNVAKMSNRDIQKMLYLLSSKKIRNTPLINAMVHKLRSSELQFTAKELKNLFFSCSALSINDQTLMQELFKNVLQIPKTVMADADAKHLYPILISCSRLSWKNEEVIRNLVSEILLLLNLDKLNINKLGSIMISLGHLNWGESDVIVELAAEKEQYLKEEDPLQWLDIVWSLVILQKASANIVQGVLADDFCQKIESLIEGKPDYIKISVQTKLLNLTGCSVLEHNNEVKLKHYKQWMDSFKKLNTDYTSSLRKSVGAAVRSLEPVSVSSNKLLDYGYVLDYELHISQVDKRSGDKTKIERVAVKLLEYKDMLRTMSDPEPDGRNAMCMRHLEKMGYHVVTVPYFEWPDQGGPDYLKKKIETALIGNTESSS